MDSECYHYNGAPSRAHDFNKIVIDKVIQVDYITVTTLLIAMAAQADLLSKVHPIKGVCTVLVYTMVLHRVHIFPPSALMSLMSNLWLGSRSSMSHDLQKCSRVESSTWGSKSAVKVQFPRDPLSSISLKAPSSTFLSTDMNSRNLSAVMPCTTK